MQIDMKKVRAMAATMDDEKITSILDTYVHASSNLFKEGETELALLANHYARELMDGTNDNQTEIIRLIKFKNRLKALSDREKDTVINV